MSKPDYIMNYFDRIDMCKEAMSNDNETYFEVLIGIAMDIIQDTELSKMETKDGLQAVVDELKP